MTIEVLIDGRRVEGGPGESVFECAERAEVRIPTSCLKNGRCRECLVEVLLSMRRRAELERAARTVEHVELETDPSFFDHFVAGCQFGPVDSRSLERLE